MNETASPEGRIGILIADDQEIIRQGLAVILDHQEGIITVGQARDGEEAISLARALHPDVVLMDIKMPHLNGIQATRIITSELPATQVIILTTYNIDDWVFDGIRAGAQAYLLKDASTEELVRAIRGVHRGESQLDPSIARKVMEEFRRISATAPAPIAPSAPMKKPESPVVEALTERETEVLSLVAQGMSNRDIAAKLFLTEGTVKNYVSTIMAKLHANDRTQVVIKAVQQGIVKL